MSTQEDKTPKPDPDSDSDSDSDPESETEPTLTEFKWSDTESEPDSLGSEYDSYSDNDVADDGTFVDPVMSVLRGGDASEDPAANTAENNFREFQEALEARRREEEDQPLEEEPTPEQLFDFPEDPENWREEDLRELWDDAPEGTAAVGWDPVWADEEDWEIMRKEAEAGRKPPIRPFYVPYRKPYPVIPTNHHDIATPKAVIEELDRIEEFLTWVSYIFYDGSTYEGTAWDDLAHGRGVFVGEFGLVRYEGEWVRNDMEGHGVVEVDIPVEEPIPDSADEARMRAEGKIIDADYMSPEDREWLKMDIEDSFLLAEGTDIIPWYEREEWITFFGEKPEKGRYRYAGQLKHGRMHGCGRYTINARSVYGRFYFGRLLDEPYGCEEEIAAMHAGIAEVAAAKARMFVNKPDGMVREQRGPYSDPQHPYFYEEEDVWMAPGFINQFYEVPDYWKTYVHEVDIEREMWLNSFYKAPLRLPMPSELSHWWEKDDTPEFMLLNTEPTPDPDDPSKETIEPIILHTPTGRFINYTMDDEYGVRLYWEPEDGVVDPDKIEFLPLGFDEFYGRDTGPKEENFLCRFLTSVEDKCKPFFENLAKWASERKELAELRLEEAEKEIELIEAEISLEEAIEDMEEILKMKEKEEQKKADMGLEEEDEEEEKPREDSSPTMPSSAKQDEKVVVEQENDDEDEEEEDGDDDEDDDAPSSFGSANTGKPFSSSSLSFTTSTLVTGIPSLLQRSFMLWNKRRLMAKPAALPSIPKRPIDLLPRVDSVTFPPLLGPERKLSITKSQSLELSAKNRHSNWTVIRLRSLASLKKKPKRNRKQERQISHGWLHVGPESELDYILSLHTPADYLDRFDETKCAEPFLSIS